MNQFISLLLFATMVSKNNPGKSTETELNQQGQSDPSTEDITDVP